MSISSTSSIQSKTSFYHLPNELIYRIFEFLNEPTLLFTCKRYYYLWKASPLVKAFYLYQSSVKDNKVKKSTIQSILKCKFLNEQVLEILERWFLSKNGLADMQSIYTSCQLPKWLLKKRKNPPLNFIKFLIDRGVPPSEPVNRPLIIACKKNNVDLVKLLLEVGVNPRQYNDGPLLIATDGNYNEIVFLLLQHYTNTKASKKGINDALNIAIRQKNKALIPILVKLGGIPKVELLKKLK